MSTLKFRSRFRWRFRRRDRRTAVAAELFWIRWGGGRNAIAEIRSLWRKTRSAQQAEAYRKYGGKALRRDWCNKSSRHHDNRNSERPQSVPVRTSGNRPYRSSLPQWPAKSGTADLSDTKMTSPSLCVSGGLRYFLHSFSRPPAVRFRPENRQWKFWNYHTISRLSPIAIEGRMLQCRYCNTG